MFKGRRVGTLTSGVTLIAFGVLFILSNFLPSLNYSVILTFWPVILILLGIELLAAYYVNKEERIRYDGWSVVLVMLLSFFSACMAIAQFIVEHQDNLNIHIY